MREIALPHYVVDVVPPVGSFVLDGEEGRHAAAVRRHRVGERIVLCDGAGGWALGEATGLIGRAALGLDIIEIGVEMAAEPRLVVLQAIPKSDRADLAVDLLTEVGVDVIVPWQAQRCVARWGPDRLERGLARWRRTAQEAAKQSRRTRVPQVADPVDLTGAVALVAATDLAFVCQEGSAQSITSTDTRSVGSVLVIVGPEGGITDVEVRALEAAGAVAVGLGPTVLRSAVAGAVAAAIVLSTYGRI